MRKTFRIIDEIHDFFSFRGESPRLKLWFTVSVKYDPKRDLFSLTVNSEENFAGLMYEFKTSKLKNLRITMEKFWLFQEEKWKLHQHFKSKCK